MNSSSQQSAGSLPYRWVESGHRELPLYNLPRRVPWPVNAAPLDDNAQELPINPLCEAIEAYLADPGVAEKDPRFNAFLVAMHMGMELDRAIQRQDFVAALALIADAGRAGRLSPNLLFNKAFILLQTGDKDGAVRCYREALEMAPDVEFLWMRLGETLEELGCRDEAILAYREARRCLPGHKEATEALLRLRVLVWITGFGGQPDGRIMEVDEFRQLLNADVERLYNDAEALRNMGGSTLHDNVCPDVALRAMARAVELEPDNLEGLRNYGESLRVGGNLEEAIKFLRMAKRINPREPWTLYHLGLAYWQQGDHETAWRYWRIAISADPNHRPTLEIMFMQRTDRDAATKEHDIADWSAKSKSWCGFLVAAESAWKRKDKRTALRYASESHKLAPDNENVFLTYTGMLVEAGEPEWVAALTKPRLASGQPTPRMIMNFARALHAMALETEAIRTLEEASQNPALVESRQPFEDQLDRWCGRVAVSEVQVALHAGGALLRPIYQTRDNQAAALFVPSGVPLVYRRTIQVSFKKDHFSLQLQQGIANEDESALNLGAFSVADINTRPEASKHVDVYLVLRDDAFVQVAAKQDGRKLPVSWSLYPPPSLEDKPPA